jgi:K+-transporting ATPase ATPase C chain
MSILRPAFVLVVLFTLLTGLAYPFAMTSIGQALFPSQANGSLIVRDGRVVGSHLIGQSFADARYFWGRPSAAGKGYDAAASSGSNLGPTSKPLADRFRADLDRLRQTGMAQPPAELVAASASGLDPHISPAAAQAQIARVALARSLPPAAVARLIRDHTRGPALGFFGEPTVNVLELNLALDAAKS